MDKHLGRLLKRLEQLQEDEELMVVVTSDHGEAFREHGLLFHGRSLYNEEIQVPLIINAPGFSPALVVNPVGLVDLAETMRQFAGLSSQTSNGESLLGLMRKPEAQRHNVVFAELLPYPRYNQHRLAAIAPNGKWKLIRNLTRNTIELFELPRDPQEQRNVFSQNGPRVADLKRKLENFADGRPPQDSHIYSADKSDNESPVRLRQTIESGVDPAHL